MLRHLRLTTLIVLAIASLAVLASACGDDGDDEASPTSTSAATEVATPTAASATDLPATVEPTDEPFSGARTRVEGQMVGTGIPVLTDVRTGAHTDYDRITFEFEGTARPHYVIEYITPPATGCGSGEPATVAGNAILRVQFQPANAHDDQGNATIDAQELTPALTTLQEAELICDFEADVQWALGLTEEVDFRVLELDNPPRIAVDVAHP